jgi:hypothetical protein
MADLAYTTADAVTALAGQLAVDLRTDDGDAGDLLAAAIDYASGRVDFYCARYSQTELAASRWVQGVATFIALRWLCLHRLNEVPASIAEEWDERKAELEQIQNGTGTVPGAANSRRPLSVTNYHVDLRRTNRQVRVDRDRSTGLAQGYSRPTDPTAETGDR